VAYVVCGAAVGAAIGVAFAPQKGSALAALTGAIVAAAGSRGPSKIALRVASFTAAIAIVFVFLAFIVSGHPWWAAAAVGVVAIVTSALNGAGPVGTALAALGLLIYVLTLVIGTVAHINDDVPLATGVVRIVLGAVAGLLVVELGSTLRDRGHRVAAAAAPSLPSPWPALWRSLRSFDEHARDGVRRAIPLAVGIYLFERSGSRDALWVFIAAFVVLMPAGKSPLEVAAMRVASTIVGVVLLGLFALVVPQAALLAIALVAVLAGILYSPTYPLLAGGLTSMGAVLLVGAPTGAIGEWAGHRLLDTAIGCGLALASTYLLWPRDKPDLQNKDDASSTSTPEAS
jgi:hypothetical protein